MPPSFLTFLLLALIIMSDAFEMAKKPLEEASTLLNPWLERWSANRIGFHKDSVHELLLKHGATVIPNFDSEAECAAEESVRVFVPLCGKTVDMAFLAKHGSVDHVVGIDGIRKALEEFSEENPDLEIKAPSSSSETTSSYDRLEGNKITLLKGDFFALDVDATGGGPFDVIWDRASIIAIDPTLREDYVQVMKKLLKPGGTILLVTLDRRSGSQEAMMAGPPFSTPEKEVRNLYESQDWVESVTLLEEIDESTKDYDLAAKYTGLTSLFELVFKIKAKG